MLQQLEHLTLTAENRYANAQELQFLQDYCASVELRLSAYAKIRDAETEIINRLEAKMRQLQPDILEMNGQDLSSMYQRDTNLVLRSAIAALLVNDLDSLREHLLLWHRTIIKAFDVKHITELTHQIMPEIIEEFVTPEEFALIKPLLQLNQAVLAY